MIATITAIRWKYSRKKDMSFPIKIRVAHKTQSRYYPIIQEGLSLSLKEEDWNELQTNPKVTGRLRKIRDLVAKWETEARVLVDKITLNGKRPFSYDRFDQEFKGKSGERFIELFDKYLGDLLADDRIGTYRSYKCARDSFLKFLGKDIEVHELTPDLLRRYETYLTADKVVSDGTIKNGAKKNTVAIYMRTLKVIFNVAATNNPHLNEFYPFARKRNDKGHYQIRTAAGKKGQALSLDDLRKFIRTTIKKDSNEWRAKQFWLFSFYGQGMNFKDIANLRVKDCDPDKIVYVRNKTKNTELHESPIAVPLTDPIKKIIKEISTGQKPDDYLFDILGPDMSPIDVEKRVLQFIKVTNQKLKKICLANGLPPITTYWARHTYASLLKEGGVSVDSIRELLGHSSTKTTESYLNNLEVSKAAMINTRLQQLVNAS